MTRAARRAAFLAAGVAWWAADPAARGAVTSWIANSGSFRSSANWSNGVPGAGDGAIFRRGNIAYEVSFQGNPFPMPAVHYVNDFLRVGTNDVTFKPSNPADYQITNATTTENGRGIIIGELTGEAAALTLSGLPLAGVAATLADGNNTQGTLNVASNFTLTGSSTSDQMLVVGRFGVGTLNILPGGHVDLIGLNGRAALGKSAGSTGTATVAAGATWNVADTLWVGFSGAGNLTIQDGGVVSSPRGRIARNTGSNGTVMVTGAGSTWTNTDSLVVGGESGGGTGSGSLTIQSGGSVTTPLCLVGFTGAASASVTGAGSNLAVSGTLVLGNDGEGGTGTISIQDGAAVSCGDALLLKNASATVGGGTSSWTIGGNLEFNSSTANTFTITGATVTVGVNIKNNGSGASTLSLNAGTLDMTGGSINADTINFRSGTLKNVAEINNGGGLFKTTGGPMTLDGVNTFTGATGINAGTLLYKTSHITGDGLVVGGGGAGATARLAQSAATPNNVIIKTGNIFFLPGGRVDVMDNKLIITLDSIGTASGGVYDGVSGMIQAGRNGGSWNGLGIITSMADAQSNLTTVAVATAGQTGHAGGNFGGVPVVASDVLVMYTWAGDANLDGTINADDYANIDFNAGIAGASGYCNGDFNYDGDINADDFALIDFNFNAQGVPFPTSSAITAVPEPAAFAFAGAIALVDLNRCRKRR